MHVTIHQTHHQVGDFDSILNYLEENILNKETSGIHVFPELFMTGYPLQDLCLQKEFIDSYLKLLEKINKSSKNWETQEDCLIILGGLKYQLGPHGIPDRIENSTFCLRPQSEIQHVYSKRLLPNYDIYDEKKYFTPGQNIGEVKFNNKNIGILICEDMWPSIVHDVNPINDFMSYYKNNNSRLDLIVNLSASPYHIGKNKKRIQRAIEISKSLDAPFLYVNRVGAEDEILFDGQSFLVEQEKLSFQCKKFMPEIKALQTKPANKNISTTKENPEHTWEALFAPFLNNATPPKLKELTESELKEILDGLLFGIKDYMQKCHFKKLTIALSGGIDSALVLAISHLLNLPKGSLEAIYMPGHYSSKLSEDLSREMCKRINVPLFNLPIIKLHDEVNQEFEKSIHQRLEGLANENIQSRLRGSLLYARSNQNSSMVLNTSNKSEIAVGYSTQYGDSVGALSPLGDLYKSEVFALAKYINKQFNQIIPEEIISRPPSAELRENQQDSQSLPSYDELDAILEGFLSYRLTKKELTSKGFSKESVDKVYRLYQVSEYKRRQFCPIIKIKSKSFGFGYRVPITKKIH